MSERTLCGPDLFIQQCNNWLVGGSYKHTNYLTKCNVLNIVLITQILDREHGVFVTIITGLRIIFNHDIGSDPDGTAITEIVSPTCWVNRCDKLSL